MATVRTESEQPLDNELVNGISPGDKAERLHASDTAVDRNAEVCAQGSDVKETTDADDLSSAANENSPPHGAALSPRNKDASEICNSTAMADEQKINEDLQSNNGELVSTEPGEDGEDTSGNLHNENSGKHNLGSRAHSKRHFALAGYGTFLVLFHTYY